MRIMLAQQNYILGGISYNTEKIIRALDLARKEQVDIVLFAELSLTGYPPEDLLLENGFIEKVEGALEEVIRASKGLMVFVGLVRKASYEAEKPLYNSCAVIKDGILLGFYDKQLLPTYDVFDERRYFTSGLENRIWKFQGKKIAVTICEDIWQHANIVSLNYEKDPIEELKKENIDLLLNLSASPYEYGKKDLRLHVCAKVAKTLNCPVFLCCQVGGNDQLLFDGYSMALDPQGNKLTGCLGFVEDYKMVDLMQRREQKKEPSHLEDLYSALVLGVTDYFQKLGFSKACLGLSGGIDSALVACIAVEALGKENVEALFLPSGFTSSASYHEVKNLSEALGISCQELNIDPLIASYEGFLNGTSCRLEGVALENIQARIRGNILMAFSNRSSALLLCTSNKSEMALGFCTLYGDLIGAISVIGDVTKTRVYALAHHLHETKGWISQSLLEKEPSPELKKDQKSTDVLPPFSLLDAMIERYVEEKMGSKEIGLELQIEESFVEEILRKIQLAEYKRKQGPPCIRVTKKAFQVGRRYPIVQRWK